IAVLVVSIVMMFVYLPILDPLLSIGISLWILSNIYKNLKDAFNVFLQHIPLDVDVEKLEAQIRSLDKVSSLHDVHLWTLDGEENIMTVHIVTENSITHEEQKELKQAIRLLCDEAHIHHVTIEFETLGEDCELKEC
ncbi:MAG: cation transporter, partial [Tannerellaceae bacterium]|nr:cation transporter [Tannerellaceae bacterium]